MQDTGLIEQWWTEEDAGDQSMEDDHQDFWPDIIKKAIDSDLTGKTILDFGCSQGGFLRELYNYYQYKNAVGIDITTKSIAVAEEKKGDLPVDHYAMSDIRSLGRERFDYAFSTAVLFLIEDMEYHANQIKSVLKAGGVYYAYSPDFWGKESFETMRNMINQYAAVKIAKNRPEDIVRAFENEGFDVQMKLSQPTTYFPASADSGRWYPSLDDKIDLEYRHRYIYKFIKK